MKEKSFHIFSFHFRNNFNVCSLHLFSKSVIELFFLNNILPKFCFMWLLSYSKISQMFHFFQVTQYLVAFLSIPQISFILKSSIYIILFFNFYSVVHSWAISCHFQMLSYSTFLKTSINQPFNSTYLLACFILIIRL